MLHPPTLQAAPELGLDFPDALLQADDIQLAFATSILLFRHAALLEITALIDSGAKVLDRSASRESPLSVSLHPLTRSPAHPL